MRIARGDRTTATGLNRMSDAARRGRNILSAGHSVFTGGGHVRRRPFFSQPYSGPFACSLAKDGSGDIKHIDVGQGWVFAGTTGKSDFTGTFDDTTDIKGDAFTAAEYALVMAIDVDPDDGQFAGAYGPDLYAVLNNGTDVEYVQSETPHSWQVGAGPEIDVSCASIVLCTFEISGAGGTFSNLKQRWKWADIYVPVYGYSGTETAASDWTAHHAYDSNLDGDSSYGWYECSWFIDFATIQRPINEFGQNHTHDVTGDTSSVSPTDPHSHSADGDLAAAAPSFAFSP